MSVTFTAADQLGHAGALNLHNANAARVLDILGYSGHDLAGGQEEAELFLGRVLLAVAAEPRDEGRPWLREGCWQYGPRPAGRTQQALAELRVLAEGCRARGVRITWG